MNKVSNEELNSFVNENINEFHNKKLELIKKVSLDDVLKRKNPYLFRAKNLNNAGEFVLDILNAYLSSSEEKVFGDFLEKLAIFVSSKVSGGKKSSAPGIDLEFEGDEKYYIVSIKSGPNWGNSSSKKTQVLNFKKAITVLKQSGRSLEILPVIGICYGKTRKKYDGFYLNIMGQQFWELISGKKDFYTTIIEPIGHRAREHNEGFLREKDRITNLFTKDFIVRFCHNGVVDWVKLVKFNSGNIK